MTQKIDRLQTLNNLWMRLTAPKEGDTIKFKIVGKEKIYEGKITGSLKSGNRIQYRVHSQDRNLQGKPIGQIEIIECNGVKFGLTETKKDNSFKPL
jgi:hypothetical protein